MKIALIIGAVALSGFVYLVFKIVAYENSDQSKRIEQHLRTHYKTDE